MPHYDQTRGFNRDQYQFARIVITKNHFDEIDV